MCSESVISIIPVGESEAMLSQPTHADKTPNDYSDHANLA